MYQKPFPNVGTPCSRDDKTRQFYHRLSQYKDHVLRMTYKYFQDDLIYVVKNLNSDTLLSELKSQKFTDVEKFQSLQSDKKQFAYILLKDIFDHGRQAVIALWVSLYVLQRKSSLLTLDAVLEEFLVEGESLVEKILMDEDGYSLPTKLKDAKNCHKNHLHGKNEKLTENIPPACNQGEESFPFSTRYVNLIIVSSDHFRKRSENELIETGVRHETILKKTQNVLQRISLNKIFRWCHRSRLVPHMVMVSGVPGVGKTTLMQKFVYDWVKGDLYQRFSFVFFFKFRELNRLDKVSLETMILHQYPYLEEQLENILQDPEKLLFIFDGLDESNHTMDFTSRDLCSHPKQLGHCGQIVVSLVRKSLLNGCSVLMTSRPTRLASIDCNVFDRIVEIIGFFPEERKIYFENFFSNPELSEKSFTYVKQNATLYTFCYLPSYCWIICTVLSKAFQTTSSDQQVTLLPRTVTQLFAIFIANILSNHSLEKSDAQKILQSIGWMGEHGVMNHQIIFEDRDLDSFYVDKKSKLLSSFLIESEEPVTYSFLHLTVQEFFSALVHYTDYSPEKLQKSLEKAKSYPDGRGEMFLRFLCGLSDGTSRSILSGYLDKQAAQASRDVITWLKNFTLEEESLVKSKAEKRHFLMTFYYLFESRNEGLVLESLQSRRRLDLSDVHMSALDCKVLAFIMETCKHIKELNLCRCSIDIEGMESLKPALDNLQNLSLAENYLPDISNTSCAPLASVIRENQSLKTLVLSRNNLGSHFSDLVDPLSSPACRIEELHLAGSDLPDTSCTQLASVIRNNQSLKRLGLSGKRLSGPHLMAALSSPACRIEELHLADNDLPDTSCTQLASVIRNNQSLKKLVLSNNRLFGPHFSGSNDLMAALSSPACRIEELHLANNYLPDTSCTHLASVIRNNQSLKILDLSGNYLSGCYFDYREKALHHFSDLMAALSSPACRIEELHLGSNNLLDTSCTHLSSLIRNNQSLKILDLSGNFLYGPHFSDLMTALSSPVCRIERLRLSYNALPDTSCTQLASVIRNNQSLKILDLSYNNLFGPHFSNLMAALSSPACRIKESNLADNDLPDTSCTQLASVIRNNQSLKILDLSNNRLSGPHFSDLMAALSSPACRIEELHLADNNLPDTSCTQLASVIRNNQSLKKLVLSDNSLSGPDFSDLMAALSSPDCRIQELHLAGNNLPDTSCTQLASVIRNNQSLKRLDLSDNYLSGRFFIDAIEKQSKTFHKLEKKKNLTDEICISVSNSAALAWKSTQSLKKNALAMPRHNYAIRPLSSPDYGEKALQNFSDLMAALSSPACRIEELRLGRNDLLDTSCTHLASFIWNNQSLKILDLSGNLLYGPDFSDLMAALSSPACRIEELQLSHNDLPDTACTQLASVIRNNQSLKILDLSYNNLYGPHFGDLEALSSPACKIDLRGNKKNRKTDTKKEEAQFPPVTRR
ncbi:NACHT, LRR and PYD domains-containing protein 12-like [Leptodactylus fuscus]|uniref:NACHT, LRR and PYD domains-containing protein 12-like n=1 Tax=Leptodactylus fuscus TaxID=238119 RepID=UPI003F4ED37F